MMKRTLAAALTMAFLLVVAACALPGCADGTKSAPAQESTALENGQDSAPAQESLTLEEYLEQGGEKWFLTGKKEHPAQAMMVSKETAFHNYLEGNDYTVTDDGVTVVLKGVVGELWTSKLSSVQSAYTKPDGSKIVEEDFAERDTFIDIVSIPSPGSRYAMFVPRDTSVMVETASGDVLHANHSDAEHGDGDYLVCRTGEDGEPDLSDVWVVNGVVFPETYDGEDG